MSIELFDRMESIDILYEIIDQEGLQNKSPLIIAGCTRLLTNVKIILILLTTIINIQCQLNNIFKSCFMNSDLF